MDCVVHGVTKSRTRLSDSHTLSLAHTPGAHPQHTAKTSHQGHP